MIFDFFYAVSAAALILLSIGWGIKMLYEGSEVMDILGLAASLLALGYIAGMEL